MKENIVIIGASEHGRVVADVIIKQELYQLVGFVDANKDKVVDLWGYPILGSEYDLPKIVSKYNVKHLVIAIGDNHIRNIVAKKIEHLDIQINYAVCIHPGACIGKNCEIANGTVIMAGAIVNPNTKIGQHCIINTRSSIDHDCEMGDFSSLAPNATTGGNVKIGEFTAIGLSASIIHGKNIGSHSVIGAGAVVLNNIEDNCVCYGVPAKMIRKRNIGEKYL